MKEVWEEEFNEKVALIGKHSKKALTTGQIRVIKTFIHNLLEKERRTIK